jgi:hypothetical protein
MSQSPDLIPITIRTVVDVTDPDYFCNKSWTLSFNMNTKSWISFHTYTPNWYIGENNFFYSGLNGGCDLEAIAGVEVPFVPTTTSTSTACIDCKPSPSTTTTTTTLGCTIEGQSVYLNCDIDGFAIGYNPEKPTTTTTSTTTFNCTTSTTTTICPLCSTYIINNPSKNPTYIYYTDCTTGLEFRTYSYLEHQPICSCSEPEVPEGMSVTYYSSGCTNCFCFELTNTTLCEVNFTYTNCEGDIVDSTISSLGTVNVCVKNMQLLIGDNIIVTGGTNSCTTNNDCTTTTTTTIAL